MKNLDKVVLILEKMSEWVFWFFLEFVWDVMGLSVGVGSGEFYVYRYLCWREY